MDSPSPNNLNLALLGLSANLDSGLSTFCCDGSREVNICETCDLSVTAWLYSVFTRQAAEENCDKRRMGNKNRDFDTRRRRDGGWVRGRNIYLHLSSTKLF